MWKLFLSLPFLLFAQESMLCEADAIAKKYNAIVAKAAPPLSSPQPEECLNTANVWFAIDLEEITTPAFEHLSDEMLWDHLREIGVQGVHLKNLKQGGGLRTGLRIDPKWGDQWDDLANSLQKKGMVLIGDAIGGSTGLSKDFYLALKNVGDYAGLYHLIEIEKRDWKKLPGIANGQFAANIPWLTLQALQKKGYVPEQFTPYVKESRWNATSAVKCVDGKVRRWIYLKENEVDPVIDWLNPSFAGYRIATADTLDSIYRLGEKIVRLDGTIPQNAKDTLALWTRKLGGYSIQESKGGIDEWKTSNADLIADTLTRPALLHALVAEDAEVLKMMYRLFLEDGVETKRLVHVLQPFDEYTCDWSQWISQPKRKLKYYDEVLTAEALRNRLLKEDAGTIIDNQPSTWASYCAAALGIQDFEKKREDLTDTHLLLAFFYAMQPGAFSFSVSDLLGTLSQQSVNLIGPNENTLYASLPGQLKNNRSFACQLRKILTVRRENQLQNSELVSVPQTKQPGLIILIHQLKEGNRTQLLAVNFGRTRVQQTVEMAAFKQTTAIDLMTGLAEKKPLESPTLHLDLPPLTGKVILFQTKYYD